MSKVHSIGSNPLEAQALASRAMDLEARVKTATRDARLAQVQWADTSLKQRLKLLRRLRHLLVERASELAAVIGGPRHRPLAETLTAEVIPLVEACRFLEREAAAILAPRRIGQRHRPLWLTGVWSEVQREALGVLLKVAPFNYPLFIPGVVTLQALAAGNAILIKPGHQGMAAANALAQLVNAAGIDGRLCRVLPEHPDSVRCAVEAGVAKVFVTGSAATGRAIQAMLAEHVVPSTLELSGCDSVLVRRDANLDLVAQGLAFGLRLNAGATCVAPRRVFVHTSRATELEGRLAQLLADEAPIPIPCPMAQRLVSLLRAALAEGAHLVSGTIGDDGSAIGPQVLAGAQPGMQLLREDVLAPVLALVSTTNDTEAVAMANDCPYALGATIFSEDKRSAAELAGQMHAGVVVVNDVIVPTADPRVPFGGRKHSGFGVTRGAEGLLEMTTPKVITIRRGSWRPHFAKPAPGDEVVFADYLTLAHGGSPRKRVRALLNLLRRLSNKNHRTS